MSRKNVWVGLILFLTVAAFLRAQYNVLHEFAYYSGDGGGAFGGLIKQGPALYGMTPWGGASDYGVIFKINANGTGYKVIHEFDGSGQDGAEPYGSLIFKGGKLYGMTEHGGASGLGVIFQVKPDGSGFTVLHHFAGGASDGATPTGSLAFFGGQFYGVTARGGTDDMGTVFRISPKGTGFAVLHSFANDGTEGINPHGALKAMGKKLYGTASCGGANNFGTVFRIDTTGANFIVLHAFTNAETGGTYPNLGTLAAKGTVLFGMTSPNFHLNPAGGGGTIFKINTDGSGFAVLHAFSAWATDGEYPYGSLRVSGNMLYGMTCYGGDNDSGTIFKIATSGVGFAVMHSFDQDQNGYFPKGDLLLSGKLAYGMTDYGGVDDYGVIFSFKYK